MILCLRTYPVRSAFCSALFGNGRVVDKHNKQIFKLMRQLVGGSDCCPFSSKRFSNAGVLIHEEVVFRRV